MNNTITFHGCTPEPLMSYLKALGIFRIVSEQADPTCRAAWRNGKLELQTKLSEEELLAFILETYEPSPIVAPWGARSGFYPGSSEKSAREALKRIENEELPRLKRVQAITEAVRKQLDDLDLTSKAKNEDKVRLLFECRKSLPDEILYWLDSCYALIGDERKFPPLLGTGGNEGSGSYVSLFAQQIVSCIIERKNDSAARNALFHSFYYSKESGPAPGHFNPETTHGPNGSQGFSGGAETNPWNYILALEGTLVWTTGVVRSSNESQRGMAAFPFTANVVGAGTEVLPAWDARRPKKAKRDIAEMWTPLWDRSICYRELLSLITDGRVSLGKRMAQHGVDFARSVANYGVDRGITSFHRYGFLMRNGQSFMAIPLGNFKVTAQRHADLLHEADHWIEGYRNGCGTKTPARFHSALRRLDNSVFDYCRFGEIERFQSILIALGQAERELSFTLGEIPDGNRRTLVHPLQKLSPDWVDASDDGSDEFKIAAALAGIEGVAAYPSIRANMEPVNYAKGRYNWKEDSAKVVWKRGTLADNLCAVLERRLQDWKRLSLRYVPIISSRQVSPATVARFIQGELDDDKIEQLLWGLICCRIEWVPVSGFVENVPRAYAIMKPCFPNLYSEERLQDHLTNDFQDKIKSLKPEPRIVRLVQMNRIDEGLAIATQRLRGSGIIPAPVSWGAESYDLDPARLAGALLLPVHKDAVENLWNLVRRKKRDESE